MPRLYLRPDEVVEIPTHPLWHHNRRGLAGLARAGQKTERREPAGLVVICCDEKRCVSRQQIKIEATDAGG